MFIFIKGMVVKIIHSFIKFKKEKKKTLVCCQHSWNKSCFFK